MHLYAQLTRWNHRYGLRCASTLAAAATLRCEETLVHGKYKSKRLACPRARPSHKVRAVEDVVEGGPAL